MAKDWNTMSSEEKGKAIKQIVMLYKEDEKITKIAYDYVELPVELVRLVILKYLTLLDELDKVAKSL